MNAAEKSPVALCRVNGERLWKRLHEVGKIGRRPDGVHCLALTREENSVHDLIRIYMEEAGLTVRVDPAGNLIGRKEGRFSNLPVVMSGSHGDTVYGGGIFDGRLGILGAVEALQTMNENGVETDHPIEVYVYRDEEGNRFTRGYSSARFLAGAPRPGVMEMVDKDGITIEKALTDCGFDPRRAVEAKLPKGYAKAHLELHIEQGNVLESKGLAVGIVSGIFCQTRGFCTLTGKASHAGATPMALRKDPLCAAAEIILAAEEAAGQRDNAVATVGRITAFPGAVNVIPGSVKLSLDIRHLEPDVANAIIEQIRRMGKTACQKRGVEMDYQVPPLQEREAKLFDPGVQAVIEAACREMGLPVHYLPSGAGHDSGVFRELFPTGMIFVRTKDGVSHNGDEYASPEDCALGAEVLMRSMIALGARGK